MKKSLLAGMAVCAALAFAGSAYAVENHKTHKHPVRTAEYGRQGFRAQFRTPAYPLVQDCVHVSFPQCSPHRGL